MQRAHRYVVSLFLTAALAAPVSMMAATNTRTPTGESSRATGIGGIAIRINDGAINGFCRKMKCPGT
jgi:hypothetical protein